MGDAIVAIHNLQDFEESFFMYGRRNTPSKGRPVSNGKALTVKASLHVMKDVGMVHLVMVEVEEESLEGQWPFSEPNQSYHKPAGLFVVDTHSTHRAFVGLFGRCYDV